MNRLTLTHRNTDMMGLEVKNKDKLIMKHPVLEQTLYLSCQVEDVLNKKKPPPQILDLNSLM